jgi:hypothetical protein
MIKLGVAATEKLDIQLIEYIVIGFADNFRITVE